MIMSVNSASGRFSPESNATLIDTDDFLSGVMDSCWTIITWVTVPSNYWFIAVLWAFIRTLMSYGMLCP